MPRTLPAALTTAMDSGAYEPYIRVHTSDAPADYRVTQPTGYKLEALRATVTFPFVTSDNGTLQYFRIERGALINGTPSTISTIWFQTVDFHYDGKFHTLTGEPLDRSYITIAADSDYETVIEAALTSIGNTIIPSYEGTAAWKAYQFYPDGKNVVLGVRKQLFTILRQKYLVFATEDGWDGTDSNMFFFCPPQTRTKDYDFVDVLFNGEGRAENRKLIFRDEVYSVHSQGAATLPVHNLGFLPSTAAFPVSNPNDIAIGSRSTKLPVHLKYRTGDKARCLGDGIGENSFEGRINVIEVLDLKSTPAWYQIIEKLSWFASTEGGAMPSTIEAAAPYTPLMTGHFDNILSVNDNNIQAAMETLDEHEHSVINVAWATYTPTWSSTGTAPSLGNGTITGKYIRIGSVVIWKVALTWGSTTTGGTGAWLFSAPVTALDTTGFSEPGGAILNDSSARQYIAQVGKFTSTSVYLQTDVSPNGVGQGTDFTWTTNDSLTLECTWEA